MGLDMTLTAKGSNKEVYWRKANAIHNWFVEKCQGGVDECQPSSVTRAQLEELIETCKKVLANHDLAEQLLPTQSGFFFGSTDYDDWYFEGLKYTVEEIETILLNVNNKKFIYRSSW